MRTRGLKGPLHRLLWLGLLLAGTELCAATDEFPLVEYAGSGARPVYGPPSASFFDPALAPQRDPTLWPRGYYPGDPLPPKTIYLSFDDGPSEFTGQIVDILRAEGVHATFFMNAYDRDNPLHADPKCNILFRYAEVLKRLVADGNVIGNHTYSHQDLACLSAQRIDFQLSTLQRQLSEVLGDQMPRIHLIRPPFGSPWMGNWNSSAQRRRLTKELSPRGIVMMWTIGWDSSDSVDWAPGEWFESTNVRYHPGSPKYVDKMIREYSRILRRADGVRGGIILMHDTHPTSRDILKPLIEELKRRGYSFGTLEDYCRWRWGPTVFDGLDGNPRFSAEPIVVSPPASVAPPPRSRGSSQLPRLQPE